MNLSPDEVKKPKAKPKPKVYSSEESESENELVEISEDEKEIFWRRPARNCYSSEDNTPQSGKPVPFPRKFVTGHISEDDSPEISNRKSVSSSASKPKETDSKSISSGIADKDNKLTFFETKSPIPKSYGYGRRNISKSNPSNSKDKDPQHPWR